MICIVITGPTFELALEQIREARIYADLVELRLDFFTDLNLESLKSLRSQFSIPMIFTLRGKEQGGKYQGSEDERLAHIRKLLQLKPEYLDLENCTELIHIEEAMASHPNTKLILSYHNFEETPEDLDGIYQAMRKTPAFLYKIAVKSKNTLDAMRLICWKKKRDRSLIAISMGPHGEISRILAPFMQNPFTYACLEENQKTAPGQLSAKTLLNQYNYRSITQESSIYGLIGDPVDRSISDITHNYFMKACNLNAVYVKLKVTSDELSAFLQLAKDLPFKGLSVTMPLKEHILKSINTLSVQANEIQAVNTLCFKKGKISGFNTDGLGALNAIEKLIPVNFKRLAILGAGGAAKAIAHEALKRGGKVTLINRNKQKANQVAQHLNCKGTGLKDLDSTFKDSYDILINCTPSALPIGSDMISSEALVMDITTKPKDTEFLKLALEKQCRIIYGYKMFVEQATGQFNLWFDKNPKIERYKKELEMKAEECLSVF